MVNYTEDVFLLKGRFQLDSGVLNKLGPVFISMYTLHTDRHPQLIVVFKGVSTQHKSHHIHGSESQVWVN